MNAHRLASILADNIPDGFQLEIRRDERMTTFRYKRIADEVWCQQVMSDVIVDYAIASAESIADSILRTVADKFREYDETTVGAA